MDFQKFLAEQSAKDNKGLIILYFENVEGNVVLGNVKTQKGEKGMGNVGRSRKRLSQRPSVPSQPSETFAKVEKSDKKRYEGLVKKVVKFLFYVCKGPVILVIKSLLGWMAHHMLNNL